MSDALLHDDRYTITNVYWGMAKRPETLFVEVTDGVVRVTTKSLARNNAWVWETVTLPYLIRWIANHPRLERYEDTKTPDHKCVMQETPDGYGCVTCLYS